MIFDRRRRNRKIESAFDIVLDYKNRRVEEADRLEAKLNQAVEDFRMLGRTGEFICPVCAYYNHGEGTTGKCVKCLTGDGFRWRGEKEEEQ